MTIEQDKISPIKTLAKAAAEHAYAPYSQFKVGAVLVTDTGEVIGGCNVENVSYGLSNCAERTAIFAAIAQGLNPKSIKQVVIYTPSEKVYSPCGACRQVLAEFLNPETPVISTCDNDFEQWTVASLLPQAFHFDINEYRNS
ncbi:cytidine deaminase [Pseudidiomarina marina]|uniref:cytidine deaminase n=1 Tax=Pseudidiomarina marina TaxID=502366 RepID=UPI003850C6A3